MTDSPDNKGAGGDPAPNSPIRVALANDYDLVVRGLAAVLAGHEDRVTVVELTVDDDISERVDVVLHDVFGTGEVHTGDVRRLVEDDRIGHVAVFTWNHDPGLVESAMRQGVHGYLSKGLDGDELSEALVRIAGGETVVMHTPRRTRPSTERRWPGQLHDLSEREAEVLALITQGYENDAIARRLYISPNTLKTRIRNLYRRMGFENRVQAAVWGVKHGFETDSGASSQTRGHAPTPD